jgi:hypothetical protein
MAIESPQLSRRALIAGAIGALGATAISALGRPLRVAGAADSISYVNDENDDPVLQAASEFAGPGTGAGTAISGRSTTGVGVFGQSSAKAGVFGESGSAAGVAGFSESNHGVSGFSTTGAGVRGDSADGRGGRFSGPKAQVRLHPYDAPTHPDLGAAGDLFVDRRNRLWFCRGGSTWVRLA